MKNVLLLLALVLSSANLSAQTVTSTANGSWLNPLNWDCFCVPLPGSTIIINHAITLNTDFGYTLGSIRINMGASLIQDATPRSIAAGNNFINYGNTTFSALLVSGGTFINETTGVLTLTAFTNYSGLYNYGAITLDSFYSTNYMNNLGGTIDVGSFLNSGTLHNYGEIVVDSFYNSGILNNNGDIDVSTFLTTNQLQNYKNIHQMIGSVVGRVDSLTNTGILVNHPGATILTDSILNSGIFTNHNLMHFVDFTNWGITYNYDSLIGTKNFWNDGQFDNKPNSLMTLGESFYNGDVFGAQIADFKNDGRVIVGNSWFSTDTVSGSNTGSFRIQNVTSNSGNMIGSYDFCDLTPPATSPYIDFNVGFVDNNITYCMATSVQQIPIIGSIHFYPNPFQNQIVVEINSNEYLDLQFVNSLGQIVLQQKIKDKETIALGDLSNGIYWVRVLDGQQRVWAVERVVKI